MISRNSHRIGNSNIVNVFQWDLPLIVLWTDEYLQGQHAYGFSDIQIGYACLLCLTHKRYPSDNNTSNENNDSLLHNWVSVYLAIIYVFV